MLRERRLISRLLVWVGRVIKVSLKMRLKIRLLCLFDRAKFVRWRYWLVDDRGLERRIRYEMLMISVDYG